MHKYFHKISTPNREIAMKSRLHQKGRTEIKLEIRNLNPPRIPKPFIVHVTISLGENKKIDFCRNAETQSSVCILLIAIDEIHNRIQATDRC